MHEYRHIPIDITLLEALKLYSGASSVHTKKNILIPFTRHVVDATARYCYSWYLALKKILYKKKSFSIQFVTIIALKCDLFFAKWKFIWVEIFVLSRFNANFFFLWLCSIFECKVMKDFTREWFFDLFFFYFDMICGKSFFYNIYFWCFSVENDWDNFQRILIFWTWKHT